MKLSFEKVAVVTGASRGIGKAIARELAGEGCRVILIARGEYDLKKAMETTGAVDYMAFDASNLKLLAEKLAEIEKEWGRIDVLVNNAGVGTFKPLHLTSFKEAIAPVFLPYGAALVACHAVLPGMIARKSGHIVNLTSPAGYFPIPNMTPYTSSRHAMVGLSLSLYEELHGKGVGVSLVCPPQVETGYFDGNDANPDWFPKIAKFFPVIKADEVGREVVKAIRYEKREVVFPATLLAMKRLTQSLPDLTLGALKLAGLWKPTLSS